MEFHGRWKKRSIRYYTYEGDDILLAIDIISEAYEYNIINWNTYKKAIGKVRTNLNGSWMFEQEIEKRVSDKENEYFNETRYMTENMGEITVKDFGVKSVYGKYNSEYIQIANMGHISFYFEENIDYIFEVINQYGKIHEISKKAIIENFINNEDIRRFFYYYDPSKEKGRSDFPDINTFDINKVAEKLKNPLLYFDHNFFGSYGDDKTYIAVQYRLTDETNWSDYVLEVYMDKSLNIYCFEVI